MTERERAAKEGSRGCRSVRYRRETCGVRERERERERAAKAGSRGCRSVRYRRETCGERERERERESSKGRLARLQKR